MTLRFPPLSAATITEGLETRVIGRRVEIWEEVASTNDLAAQEAEQGGAEGLVVLAESQTAGRGRHGRTWTTPPGSAILMSVLINPPVAVARPEWLVCLTAVSVAEALSDFVSVPVEIKWPNDLLLQDRKVAGILVEKRAGIVIGIGINVRAAPELRDRLALQPAALAEFAPGTPDRSRIVRRLLECLDRRYSELCQGETAALVEAWQSRLAFVGRRIIVETHARTVTGTLIDIDPLIRCRLWVEPGGEQSIPVSEILSLLPAPDQRTNL